MRQISPLVIDPAWPSEVEKVINEYYLFLIFRPLQYIMRDVCMEIINGKDPLITAIKSGKIRYENGEFTGSYDSNLTKRFKSIGAKYDGRSKSWKIEYLPPEISFAVTEAKSKFIDASQRMISALDAAAVKNIAAPVNFTPAFTKILQDIEKTLDFTTKSITIKPKVNKEMLETLARDWSNNLDLYVRGWAGEAIRDMRETVLQKAFSGYRAEAMEEGLQRVYGVSKSKAKFLARQETSLLMSKYTAQRYRQAGITRYKWSTSHDERVRDRHRELNGKVFYFSDPPPSGDKGEPGKPGEPFGCRCIAIPIVDDEDEQSTADAGRTEVA